ncbi:hypothetical protein DUNSADRAFT_18329 [Dunaliella salina]|uniref:Encoded protein n=1 Tax=Dunaliella salina TaxID=3046 RepID=A0ABQ7GZ84_DUNSA|nr:hypothetical protein DUNSADRAFT_18329 [Dunaliella salina]|eukprot:KAF5839915.1 hypothetical protein DUNSADRAFT_18329 [Dunaliella salina]
MGSAPRSCPLYLPVHYTNLKATSCEQCTLCRAVCTLYSSSSVLSYVYDLQCLLTIFFDINFPDPPTVPIFFSSSVIMGTQKFLFHAPLSCNVVRDQCHTYITNMVAQIT